MCKNGLFRGNNCQRLSDQHEILHTDRSRLAEQLLSFQWLFISFRFQDKSLENIKVAKFNTLGAITPPSVVG